MVKAPIASAVTAGVIMLTFALPAQSADLRLQPRYAAQAAECGPCGCLRVDYVYHRQLESTYGIGFDPRNYDETQPHYYLGPIRAYPRYSFQDCPVPGPY